MTFTQLPTQEEISNLQKASLVSNTERNTSKWLRVVDHFNKSCGITNSIEQIDSLKDLENYLCQFITWLQKEDGRAEVPMEVMDLMLGEFVPEMVVGWYHSHPVFGYWLSSSVKGKVVTDAFRLINPQMLMLGQEP
ncbi:14927_t:CDS:2, partial [Funneliformis caledonium]